jgi:orotidine-5'-phosphate decarboxylase
MEWNKQGCCGAVVGATYPDELRRIREILGDEVPLLIPGIGKQGGDVEKTVRFGMNQKGEQALINSSRGIIYAGSDEDYAEKASEAAQSLKDRINSFRKMK